MKTVLKILIKRGAPPNIIKTLHKALNVKLPRKIRFSGNFHLNTPHVTRGVSGVDYPN